MLNLARSVGRLIIGRDSQSDDEICEADISEYLYQREEIALRSLQDSIRDLKKYEMEPGSSQSF